MRTVWLMTIALGCAAVDSDGDGLSDRQESRLGTDPALADSDGDGQSDGDEVDAGTNPLYALSHTYAAGYRVGACPTPPSPEDAGPTGETSLTIDGTTYRWDRYREGDLVEDVVFVNALGEDVHLWSFCGLTIFMTVSAGWCGPCRDQAPNLAIFQDSYAERGYTSFEFLYQNNTSALPTAADLQAWDDQYDLAGIPVVAPPGEVDWLLELEADGYIPTNIVIGPDLRVLSMDDDVVDPGPFLPDDG